MVAAIEGGADRVELCAALYEGGLTPSYGAIATVAKMAIDARVMIRPRSGDFYYSSRELDTMEANIRACRDLGINGVVLGVLDEEGDIAVDKVKRLLRTADGLEVTFHRAFDLCRDPMHAMFQLAELGISRILTSGQQATVPEGLHLIKELIDHAPPELTIMPGCGITPDNLLQVIAQTGATEFHATAFERVQSPMRYRNERVYMGIPSLPEYERERTSARVVRQFMTLAANIDRPIKNVGA